MKYRSGLQPDSHQVYISLVPLEALIKFFSPIKMFPYPTNWNGFLTTETSYRHNNNGEVGGMVLITLLAMQHCNKGIHYVSVLEL